MVNGIRIIYSCGLNKRFSLKFCVGSGCQHETPEEDRRTYQLKRWEYNKEDKENSLNTLRDEKEKSLSERIKAVPEQVGINSTFFCSMNSMIPSLTFGYFILFSTELEKSYAINSNNLI